MINFCCCLHVNGGKDEDEVSDAGDKDEIDDKNDAVGEEIDKDEDEGEDNEDEDEYEDEDGWYADDASDDVKQAQHSKKTVGINMRIITQSVNCDSKFLYTK